ncbi:MAG: hypothetical protein ACAH89_07620 [Rariglobus sp.]|nr:hypothetical protein [Rariglobus sp.]
MKHPLRFSFFVMLAALMGLAGCNSSSGKKKKNFETAIARFFLESEDEREAFASVTLPVSGVKIAINNKPIVTEFDFTGVQIAQADLGPFLVFNLTPEATRDVYRVTTSNQGKRLVLFINNMPVGARMIEGPFSTGAIAVFVAIPDELLPKVVKNLDATSKDYQKQIEKEKK